MAEDGRRAKALAVLAAVPDRIRKEVRKTIEKQLAAIVAAQKRAAPVESGALRESIRYVMGDVDVASSANLTATSGKRSKGSRFAGSAGGVIRGDPDLTGTVIAGDREAFYARFVEFGTAPHSLVKGNLVEDMVSVTTKKGVTYRMKVKRWTRPMEKGHPGAQARPFFYGPFRARRKIAKTAVARAIGRAVKDAAK